METTIISQRLKELRNKAGLTQVELSNALNGSINVQTIKKYESLSQNLAGIRLENICTFADFYNVPTDYILGRIDSTSVDLTEQAVYETLGLSSGAIRNLNFLNNHSIFSDESIKKQYNNVSPIFVIDYLLKDLDLIINFPRYILKYCYNKAEFSENRFKKDIKHLSKKMDIKKISLSEFKQYIKDYSEKTKNKFADENKYYALCQIEMFIDDFYKRFIDLYLIDEFYQTDEGKKFKQFAKKHNTGTKELQQKMREGVHLNAQKNK